VFLGEEKSTQPIY